MKRITDSDQKSVSKLHIIPKDLKVSLLDSKELMSAWNKLTPLAKNEWICWVTIVKKEETRKDHLKRLSAELLEGKKRPCCWPGCPHRRPSALKYFSKKLMEESLGSVLGINKNRINVKATTTERLGFLGRGEGIASEAICSISMTVLDEVNHNS